jgi:hypothetical protein
LKEKRKIGKILYKYITSTKQFDVYGFLHRNINLIKKPRRHDRVVEFIIPVFLNCSTCFGRHTAHHQKLKNCNCRFWFYICFWLAAAAMAATANQNKDVNPEPTSTVFELLMMGGVSPETC